ncbi:glucokinase [Undibacterium sp. TJN19]|uniref:glucokinase n=1 Tax=Undibacterium sp. TJN19 TaxID=3413055 RepID=UPI003BF457C1
MSQVIKHSSNPIFKHARLLADVGGTNARFALEVARQQFEAIEVLPCADYPSLLEAMQSYLNGAAVKKVRDKSHLPVVDAAIAIANPVDGDKVRMTNHDWSFSISDLRQKLDLSNFLVVNDFTALAMALPYLDATQRQKIGGGVELPGRCVGLIGAGTGLGVSGILPVGQSWVALASEGGHATFSPSSPAEVAILQSLWQQYDHVSAERLLSGKGLEQICHAISGLELDAAEITRQALEDSCQASSQTVAHFCAILGSVAGNVALTLGATGGMYIGGGIAPRLGRLFSQSAFRARFEAKGRLSTYLAQIPTYLITEEYPAFLGVSAILEEHLQQKNAV